MPLLRSLVPPALSKPRFRLFAIGQAVSIIGSWVQQIALSWLAYRLTRSLLVLGLVGFLLQIPFLVVAPLAGAIVDRVRRVRLLVIVNLILTLLAALLAFCAALGVNRIEVYLALALAIGIATAFETPARQSLLAKMVEDKSLVPSAIGVNSMLFNLGRMLGPPLAGLLLIRLSEAWCFIINALSYAAIIAALVLMRIPDPKPEPRTGRMSQGFAPTAAYLWRHPVARYFLPMVSAIAVLALPYQHMMPSVAVSMLGGDSSTVGLLMGSAGVGALFSAILLAMQRSSRVQIQLVQFAPFVVAVALIAFSQARTVWFACLTLTVLGGAILMTSASTNTLLQQSVGENWRGRAIGVYVMCFLGMAPLGNLLTGAIAEWIGLAATLAVNGVLILLAAVVVQVRLRRNTAAIERLKAKLGG